jgi:hypothetical protein
VIEQAGEWADLAPGFVGDVERRRPLIDRMLGRVVAPTAAPVVPTDRDGRILPGDDELRALIKQVLVAIADEGSVVITSHAASYALAGRDVLRVLVTASGETRARRLGIAEKTVNQDDAGRSTYLKQFYGIDREAPTDYDLVVNTDVLTPEQAADAVVAAVG